MDKGFWKIIPKPIIGLAPMDGVTDAAFRYIVDKYGAPSVLFTEFVSADGIAYGASHLLNLLIHHKSTTPIVAQALGITPSAFYQMGFVIGEMGFDGMDINMGCPDSNIVKRGGGSALIKNPKLALEIIASAKKGLKDWSEGKALESSGLNSSIIDWIHQYQKKHNLNPERKSLPVSVKTRIGFETITTEDWIKQLLEASPAVITIHGRTFLQIYSGEVNWEEISKATKLTHSTGTMVLGNGDIHSITEAQQKIGKYEVDGVLIGRSVMGNPWIFSGESPDFNDRLKVALEQCQIFMEMTPNLHFLSLRKHLAWYCKGSKNATKLRLELMRASSLQEVMQTINSFKCKIN